MAYEKNTWKVVKGMSSFDFDLIFDFDLYYTATGRAIFTDLVMIVKLCLRIDVFKINYCLNILSIIWFLYMFYFDIICFAEQ